MKKPKSEPKKGRQEYEVMVASQEGKKKGSGEPKAK